MLGEEVDSHHAPATYAKFQKAFLKIQEQCSDSTNPRIMLTLGHLWLQAAKLRYEITGHFSTAMNNCMSALVKPDVVESINGNVDKEQILAYICMTVVAESSFGPAHEHRMRANQILSRWLGKTVTADITMSVEKTATLLYGPAALALFGNDIKHHGELPALLFQQRMPLLGLPTQKQSASSYRSDLPGDISL